MDTTFIPSELNTPHQIVNAYDKLSNLKASDKPDMEKLDKEFDTDEYESLPKNITSTSIHLTAGAVAGVMEHCIVYPIDSVKVSGWMRGQPGRRLGNRQSPAGSLRRRTRLAILAQFSWILVDSS